MHYPPRCELEQRDSCDASVLATAIEIRKIIVLIQCRDLLRA